MTFVTFSYSLQSLCCIANAFHSGMAQSSQFSPGGLLQRRLFSWFSLRSRRSAKQRHLQPRLLRAGTVHGVLLAAEQLVADDSGYFGSSCITNVMMDRYFLRRIWLALRKALYFGSAHGNIEASTSISL